MDKIIAKSSIIKKVNFENKVFQILEDLRAGKSIIAGEQNGSIIVREIYIGLQPSI